VGTLTLALCGDVMLGRGVDQILAHPGDPALREEWVTDAREYVALAEARSGAIPRPVADTWPWGDALEVLDALDAFAGGGPAVRIVDLETAITRSDDFAPSKAVCHRMSPRNVGALAVARPDVCVLANNHVLDFGARGLAETLDVLERAGLRVAGAGRDDDAAARPAVVDVPGVTGTTGRVVVLAFGMLSSGVPASWAAAPHRPGVNLVPHASPSTARGVVERVREVKRPGDVVVVSVHWGSNWGWGVGDDDVRFAHALIDGGVDVVHGHSSHHPRPIEVYRGRPVLYGCGDLINDYEGISGFEQFRGDLRLVYVVEVEAETGELVRLRMVPFRADRLRLERAVSSDDRSSDAAWLAARLTRASRAFGTRIEVLPDGALVLVGLGRGSAT